MLSVSEARERILATFNPVEPQTVPIERAATRVLAEEITAGINLPVFDNSAVDGFALHKADLASPRTLKVVADIRAGESPEIGIQPGQAARVMTGAPLPPGAEAVIMLEDTDFNLQPPAAPAPETVTTNKTVQVGSNIRRRGEDLQAGEKVLSIGTRLRAQDIGLLAMLGVSNVPVYRQPRLALLSSGDELIPVESPLAPGKIHESNSFTLAAMAEPEGAEVIRLGVARDTREDIRSKLDKAVKGKADVIISSAGVSVGAFDFVKSVIEEDGELGFWKVNMRPGRPLAFGKYRGIPFFGLPGNPVSAFIGFEVFVRPALKKLSGQEVNPHQHQTAILAESLDIRWKRVLPESHRYP